MQKTTLCWVKQKVCKGGLLMGLFFIAIELADILH